MLIVSSDFKLVLAAVFSTGWRIITSFHIPGTNMNVAEFIFACMMVVFVLKIVPAIVGFRGWQVAQEERAERKAYRASRRSGSGE